MAYQFVHLDSFARKPDKSGRSTEFIFNEAQRVPSACVHVEAPKPPVVLHGLDIEALRSLHDTDAADAKTPGAKGKLRKIRQDQKTLHTIVASHPFTVDEVKGCKNKRAEIDDWETRTIVWLKAQYGDSLQSVIRHEDERYWHIHAYVLPIDDPEYKAIGFHPGVTAKRATVATGPQPGENAKSVNKRGDAAYKNAMRSWQDEYHKAVALPSGLTRLGPARRRLTRAEWKAEQVQARSLKVAVAEARIIKAKGRIFVKKTKTEAAKTKAHAASIALQSNQLKSRAGKFRTLLDGLRHSHIREQIQQEFSDILSTARSALSEAMAHTREERKQRRIAEDNSIELRDLVRRYAAEIGTMRRHIESLTQALATKTNNNTLGGPKL